MTTEALLDLIVSSIQDFAIKQNIAVSKKDMYDVVHSVVEGNWMDMKDGFKKRGEEYYNSEEDATTNHLSEDMDGITTVLEQAKTLMEQQTAPETEPEQIMQKQTEESTADATFNSAKLVDNPDYY